MIEYTEICININYRYYIIERQEFKKKKNGFVTHPRPTIIKIGISFQVTVVFQMSDVI